EDELRRDGDEQADEHVDVQMRPEHVAEVGAEHDQDALRDVDEVEHAEDQCEPDRHQAIDTALEHAIGDGLQEGTHVSTPLRSPISPVSFLGSARSSSYPRATGVSRSPTAA